MTTEEKAAAFDALALALTNQWHDGRWSWWCRTPPGGPLRATRQQAVRDLVEWVQRNKGHHSGYEVTQRFREGCRISLPVLEGSRA